MSNPEPFFVSDALLQQAERLCQQQLAGDPRNLAALTSLAQIFRKQGNLSEAAVIYEQLKELNPGDRDAEYTHAILAGTAVPPRVRAAPFVLIRNFLPSAFHETLVPLVLASQEQLVPAKVGNNEYNPQRRESLEIPGNWEGRSRFRELVLETLPQVLGRLQVAPFEIEHVDLKLRIYLDGHFFRLHMDCPANSETSANRRVSYVYFFHRQPRGYTGGALLLYDTDIENNRFTTASFTRVEPDDNSILFFPSACYHSVVPVSCPSKEVADSRFVINGHFHKRMSPAPPNQTPAASTTPAAAPPLTEPSANVLVPTPA